MTDNPCRRTGADRLDTGKELSILRIVPDTVVDGPGIRTAIYSAGCPHRCPGCQNPQSWDIHAGETLPLERILQTVLAEGHSGITFSGGDPMYQATGFARLAQRLKAEGIRNIWCYTGFLFEQVATSPRMSALLPHIDVLVDGPFVRARESPDLPFRGSDNQRLIDVPRSLREGQVVLFHYDPRPVF